MKCIQIFSLRSTLYKEKLAHSIISVCSPARPSPLNKFGTDRYIFMNLVFSTISVKKKASEHSRRVTANPEYISIFTLLSHRKWQETGFVTSQYCACILLPAFEAVNPSWHSLIQQMYLLSIPTYTTQTCFQGNYFRSVYGPSSDLYIQEYVKETAQSSI
jgi:hypothetical protein